MLRSSLCAGAFAILLLEVQLCTAKVYFKERFDSDPFDGRWVKSAALPEKQGDWEYTAGEWHVDAKVNRGIMTSHNEKHHAASAPLKEPFSTQGKDLVLQYSAKNERLHGGTSFCGGSYIKLHPAFSPATLDGDTPYSIMFGPDQCGYDAHIHVILNSKRDGSGTNLLKSEKINLEASEKDELTHVYTLVLRADDTYEVLVDMKSRASGKLRDDWDFPPKQIDDPTDTKPSDWPAKQIPDPEHTKPGDWDREPRQVPDPDAAKPDDWNEADDGKWEPPLVDNPKHKGEWVQRQIDNPEYKGEFKAKQVHNPAYVEDGQLHAFDSISRVSFELWTVNNGTIFDNIVVCDNLAYAKSFAEKTWGRTRKGEAAAKAKWEKESKTQGDNGADATAADGDSSDAVEPEATAKEEL